MQLAIQKAQNEALIRIRSVVTAKNSRTNCGVSDKGLALLKTYFICLCLEK